jgi:hypothetical protein
MKTVKNRKNTAHTIYRNAEGKRLVGVTTVVGLLDKPQLRVWANRIGLQGIDLNSYMDDLANVGTLAHEMIQCHFTGKELDTNEYSKNDIDRAENAMISFLNWVDTMKIKPIFNEAKLNNNLFGGTVDMYAEIDGKKVLVDFKTGSGIYEEYLIQLSGYKILLEENGHRVDQAMIVRVGRDEEEGFEVKSLSDLTKYEQIFKHLLAIYYLKKK